MTDDLAQRVGKLEQDVAVIRQDVNTLTIRSENFATKVDIANICTEMATMRGEFREEMTAMRGEFKKDMAAMRGELKEDMANMRGEFKGEMADMRGSFQAELRQAINRQTALLLTIIPATLAAIAAVGAWFR
ncbi:hypothetical protein [Kalamiella sp. sgz302252]|uniref:hypothetical protein n=1 Tax=Pantoea sp. sgz302252 TaxID=3341827 RepID=UPI0036D3E652